MFQSDLKPGLALGELTLVRTVKKKGGTHWKCICNCGKEIVVKGTYLVRDAHPKRSCGCKTWEHKEQYPREKGIWRMLFERCYNPNHVSYKHYGGRGITVHPDWWHSRPNNEGWKAFFAYMGPAPSPTHQIDRYPDNDGNYEPGNVRWCTPKENANNKYRKPTNG